MTQLINFWQTSSNINIDYANYEASVNLTADFAWTGTHTYSNTITFNGDVTFNSTSTSGGVTVTNSSGASAFILDISTGGYNSLLTQIAITTVPGDGGSAGIQFIDGKDSTSFTYNNAIYTVDGAGTYFSDANAGDFLIVAGYAPGTTSGQTVRIGAVKSTASPSSLAISNTALTCTVPGTWTAEQTFEPQVTFYGTGIAFGRLNDFILFGNNNSAPITTYHDNGGNDGLFISSFYSTGVLGKVNTSASVYNGLAANSHIFNLLLGDDGMVATSGTVLPNGSGTGPGKRNILDDGNGNMSIAGNFNNIQMKSASGSNTTLSVTVKTGSGGNFSYIIFFDTGDTPAVTTNASTIKNTFVNTTNTQSCLAVGYIADAANTEYTISTSAGSYIMFLFGMGS